MVLTLIGWILRIISTLLNIYGFLIVIYALLSWVPSLFNSKFGQIIRKLVEPYLGWFERLIPPIAGISFAPVLALLVVYFLNNYVLLWIANILVHILVR